MSESKGPAGENRRGFLRKLTGTFFGLSFVAGSWTALRSLVPNVLYEPPKRFKIGGATDFPEGVTFLDEHRIFLFRQGSAFHAVSGVCTHLGCTVKFSPFSAPQELTVRRLTYASRGEFHCPCHGSKFRDEGTNFAGPAPRPLSWHRLEISPEDGQIVVDLATDVDRDFRLVV